MSERAVRQISLVDWMAIQMNRSNVSDLKGLNTAERLQLAYTLESVSSKSEENLWDWNDALTYLTNEPMQQTVAEAKEKLVKCLLGNRS